MANQFAIREGGVYTVDRILNILEAAQSLFYFHDTWKQIGYYLGVNDAKIKAIHTAFLIGTIETLREVVRQILKAWAGVDANRATLEALLNILEENKMRRCLEDIVEGFNLVRNEDGTLVAPAGRDRIEEGAGAGNSERPANVINGRLPPIHVNVAPLHDNANEGNNVDLPQAPNPVVAVVRPVAMEVGDSDEDDENLEDLLC